MKAQQVSTKLRTLEFRVFDGFKHWREKPVIWLALSGGFDSRVLLNVMVAVASRWGVKLKVIHVHHGFVDDSEQLKFRDRAEALVRDWARVFSLDVKIVRGESASQSEAALRELRRQAFTELDGPVATAHHFDDVFETRLIRLLRGTGGRGLGAMTAEGEKILRPFLGITRQEMVEYQASLPVGAAGFEPCWLDDPSNHDRRYLRTRVREELIPVLDRIRAGGAVAMARSLEIIAESSTRADGCQVDRAETVLLRAELMELPLAERRQRLGDFLRERAISNYTSRQINEVLKRLDSSRRRLTFEVVPGQRWEVDTEIRLVSID
jgi:tRNA(Ile)-lysidine synthase